MWLDRWLTKLEKQNDRQLKNLFGKLTGRKPDQFFQSRRWQRVRYEAIKKYGRKCLACGVKAKEIHVDHVKPRSKYPELALELSNLQTLCRDCNFGKGNWDTTDWR